MSVRRLLFAVLWILSLVGISFYGGAVSYGFFFGLTLLPVLSLLYLGFVYLRFRIYQELESRNVVSGEPVSYYFVLPNEDYFAFSSVRVKFFSSFSTVEKLPDNPEYELLPGDRYTYETRLVCNYRGEYEVGVKEVVLTDFLRLFSVRYRVPTPIKAVVLPKVIEVSEIESMRDLSVYLQREVYGADSEPDSVVRDYMPGDSVRQMHWRATAKEQKLKIRGRIGEEQQGIGLFFDTRRYSDQMEEYLPVENKLLETVLALGLFLARKNIAFAACCGQGGKMEERIAGLQDFERFYQQSASLQFEESEEPSVTLEEAVGGRLSLCRLVFCVVQELSEALLDVTEGMTRRGQTVVLYVIGGEPEAGLVRQSNERRRIRYLALQTELEGGL